MDLFYKHLACPNRETICNIDKYLASSRRPVKVMLHDFFNADFLSILHETTINLTLLQQR